MPWIKLCKVKLTLIIHKHCHKQSLFIVLQSNLLHLNYFIILLKVPRLNSFILQAISPHLNYFLLPVVIITALLYFIIKIIDYRFIIEK